MSIPLYTLEGDNLYVGAYNPSYKQGYISSNLDRLLRETWNSKGGYLQCVCGYYENSVFSDILIYNRELRIFASPMSCLTGDWVRERVRERVRRCEMFQWHDCKFFQTPEFWLTGYGWCDKMSEEKLRKYLRK